MIEFAMKRAATLIEELSGGRVSHEPIPFIAKQIEPNEVLFNFSRCNKIIGNEIEKDVITDILTALDIKIIHNNGDSLKLKIPTYRVDVVREVDVIEEVLRIYGFNNIELPKKLNISLSKHELRDNELKLNVIADMLSSKGFFEMMNNSLTSSKWIEEHGKEAISNLNSVYMLNPLSSDLDIMRQTLIFQGLSSIVHNKTRESNLTFVQFKN